MILIVNCQLSFSPIYFYSMTPLQPILRIGDRERYAEFVMDRRTQTGAGITRLRVVG